MPRKNQKSPGIYYLRLLFVIILLALSYLADFLFIDQYPWIGLLWTIPVTAAAIWLGGREALGAGLIASLLSLETVADTVSEFSIWMSAGIGSFGVVMAIVAGQMRRTYAQANIVQEALNDSPLAFAELRFPGYTLINFNESLFRLTGNRSTAGAALTAILPGDAGGRLAALMDRAAANGQQVNEPEFRIIDPEGHSSYWNISAIPMTTIGRRTPRSVALFGSEVTDAVQRAINRDAALRISNAIMANLELDETITVALESLMYIAGTDAGGLFLLEDEQWLGQAGAGTLDNDVARSLRFPYEDLPTGIEAIKQKRTLAIEQADQDPRVSADKAARFRVKSAMVIPLISGNRALGAVWCFQTGDYLEFSDEQIEFATVVGAQIALAIDNASIYGNEYSLRKSIEAIESISEDPAG